jgi:hypothetical protein
MILKKLLDADMEPYWPEPRFWITWNRSWGRPGEPIRGMQGRLWFWGFALSFDGVGTFHNGSRHCIFFRYDPLEYTLGTHIIGVSR